MKNISKKIRFSVGLVLAVATVFGLFAFATPTPVSAATACDGRIITGTVDTGTPPTRARFTYSTSSSTVSNGGGTPTAVQTFNTEGSFPIEQLITGLTENTTYYYRLEVTNNYGTANGSVLNFTTAPCTQTSIPTVNLTASPSSIQYGNSSTLLWTSTNANSCSAYWTSSTGTSGGAVVSPSNTTTYSITCSNSTGSATDTATVSVGNNTSRPTVNISADDTNIDSGDSTIVRWTSNNADYCTGSGGSNGWSGNRNLSGSFNTGSLNSSKTYSITCSNGEGSASDSVTVRVNDNGNEEVSVDLRADETTVDRGDSTTLRWSSDNADSCRGTGGRNGWSGSKPRSGSFNTGSLNDTTSYKIICENDNSSDEDDDSVTVRVANNQTCRDTNAINYGNSLPCRYNQVNNQPTVVIYADSTNVAYNGATNIRWSTTNATSCNASGGSIGWAGVKSIGPGSFYTGSLTSSRTYSITCSNDVGSSTDFVTVNVRGRVLGVTTPASAYLVVNSSVDRNRPIVPTLDNTNPCPGDEINYTLTYQNIGNGSVRNLVLRIDLPSEVTYLSSNPNSSTMSGNTLIFNLGTLGANKSGTVAVRVLLRDNVPAGTNLNFPATLSYVDPSGSSQSVSANVSANVCGVISNLNDNTNVNLGASVFGAGFLPTSIFGWLLLIILILILILLARYLFGQSFQRKTVTTYDPMSKTTTTMTH